LEFLRDEFDVSYIAYVAIVDLDVVYGPVVVDSRFGEW
jgi:hypothetical protein